MAVLRSDDSKPMNNKIYQEQQRKLYKIEVLNAPFNVFWNIWNMEKDSNSSKKAYSNESIIFTLYWNILKCKDWCLIIVSECTQPQEVSHDLSFNSAALFPMMNVLSKGNKNHHSDTGILAAATAELTVLAMSWFHPF